MAPERSWVKNIRSVKIKNNNIWVPKPTKAIDGWSPEAIQALKNIETARFYMNKERYLREINKLKKIAPHLTEQIDLRFGIEKPKKLKEKVKQTVVTDKGVINHISEVMMLTLEEQAFATDTQQLINQIKGKP